MKWVKPFAIGYEYVYIPDKVNNLTAERLLTLSEMIYICIDHATIKRPVARDGDSVSRSRPPAKDYCGD